MAPLRRLNLDGSTSVDVTFAAGQVGQGFSFRRQRLYIDFGAPMLRPLVPVILQLHFGFKRPAPTHSLSAEQDGWVLFRQGLRRQFD